MEEDDILHQLPQDEVRLHSGVVAADPDANAVSLKSAIQSNAPSDSPSHGNDQLPTPGLTPVATTLEASVPHLTREDLESVQEATLQDDTRPSSVAVAEAVSPRSEGREDAKSPSSPPVRRASVSHVRRLSAAKMQELALSPGSLPIAAIPEPAMPAHRDPAPRLDSTTDPDESHLAAPANIQDGPRTQAGSQPATRPAASARTLSTPPVSRLPAGAPPSARPAALASNRRNTYNPSPRPPPLELQPQGTARRRLAAPSPNPETTTRTPLPPTVAAVPLPPMSIPTLLQLELAGQRPSPLYIHQSRTADVPYESSAVKFERLQNFLLVPAFLERTMTFGTLACFDAWLWTLTILPIRFCGAAGVLLQWWAYMVDREVRWLLGFVWYGLGRLWERGLKGQSSKTARQSNGRSETQNGDHDAINGTRGNGHANGIGKRTGFKHRRTQSLPSALTTFHKADLLQGLLIIMTSMALMNLDASRMYHLIRAQSTLKLYAIYSLIEVGDRLLSALGQDIIECLLCAETLSRNSSGRSRLLRPFGMFILALVYNIGHSVTLLYQVVTLNVAVNSYSNALVTLLMSGQVVEVKSSVFKRFEKENTFQLTCADIVERFNLWIVLLIIGMRNVVELGGLSVPGAGKDIAGGDDGMGGSPLHSASSLPTSFTILPSWLLSIEVLSPFLVVIGSEMIVDWIKHGYIAKFNNIKHTFYTKSLDVLCKDYYTNAFVTPSLTRRLGVPLLPLSCLFIRSVVQTYHMFLATHIPTPLPPSTQTSLSVESAVPSSPAVAAALDRLDLLLRNALGRAVHGYPYGEGSATTPATSSWLPTWASFSLDDLIAGATMVVVFFLGFLVLLLCKLLLGMVLLRYSRDRYSAMRATELAVSADEKPRESYELKGSKRAGGHGEVEVGEERRKWLYGDDTKGLEKAREKEAAVERGGDPKKDKDLSGVMRFDMVARRIW